MIGERILIGSFPRVYVPRFSAISDDFGVWTPSWTGWLAGWLAMVSQMLQNSTTCIFIFNSLYLCSTTYIYIQHFIFIFNNTHFLSTSTNQFFSFNKNICSTSTKNNFIQQQYLFNCNPNDFHSTKIIIQLLPKSFSFNNNICSTSTTIIFIQQ